MPYPGTDIQRVKMATSEEVVEVLLSTFNQKKYQTYCWFPDVEYILPTQRAVEQVLTEIPIEDAIYTQEFPDCDDFADALRYLVKKNRYFKGIRGHCWAFMELHGLFDVDGDKEMDAHALNACLTSDNGLIRIEPQADDRFAISKFKRQEDACWIARI